MNTEAALHRAVAAFLRVSLDPPTIWTTIPAGGGGRVRGAQLKAMGLQRGWPDILVMHPSVDGPIVLGIELKTKTGRMSPEQRAVMQAFKDCCAWYVLCRSVEEVEAALRFVDVPLRATVTRRSA